MSGHGIDLCACGAVVAQCRCDGCCLGARVVATSCSQCRSPLTSGNREREERERERERRERLEIDVDRDAPDAPPAGYARTGSWR